MLGIRRTQIWWGLGGISAMIAVLAGVWILGLWPGAKPAEADVGGDRREVAATGGGTRRLDLVAIDLDQQSALGIRTAEVELGTVGRLFDAYGEVIPDESQFAYITPRAEGIVREVLGQIGQQVEQGQLLARVDSERVADARLALITSLQQLEVARAKLNWQESIYRNALDMIDALNQAKSLAKIQEEFTDRPVGQVRQELLRAYAEYQLSVIQAERYATLQSKDAVSLSRFQTEKAKYEVDRAIYRGLMDRMAFEVTLDYTIARQTIREASTAVKVALEILRVLGVSSQDILDRFESGELTRDSNEEIDSQETLRQAAELAISPSRDLSALLTQAEDHPVSTYELRAPFSGTILERERIVPGVVVTGTDRMFTMANLDTVWVEVHVHESDFDLLVRSNDARISFTSLSFPGKTFEGDVLYTGDVVDRESRTVRMISTARNPGHLLKPGMFVDVVVIGERPPEVPVIPGSAVLTDDDRQFVFVRIGPERFERRNVEVGDQVEGEVIVQDGLCPGEEIVIAGGFELKSTLLASAGLDEQGRQLASGTRSDPGPVLQRPERGASEDRPEPAEGLPGPDPGINDPVGVDRGDNDNE